MKKNDDLLCVAQQRWKKTIRIMKLTVGLLLMTMITASAVNTYSQNARISLNVKDATILDIFKEIERNSEFGFFYKSEEMNLEKRQSIDISGATIDEILKKVLDENCTYKILDKNIVVTKGSLEGSQQQTRKISGKVTDTSGATLPGVSVVVKGTTIGTITDSNGIYSLSNVPENSTLQFSFVGMNMQEIKIGTKSELNIVLEAGSIGLEEVVAVGYGTNKKRDISGAISTLKSDELNIAPMASTTNALSGKIPGLQTMQTTGEPGNDASRLSIRGFGNALVIVDGVEQGFNNISSGEIESISVLKDASAAIYGARAGNGVILVTTKRGKTGKPSISFNSSITYSGNINYPKPMSAGQYTELYRESQLNSGVKPELTKYSPADIRNYYAGTNPDSTNTDWWKATMKDWTPMQQYDLSLI